MSFDAAAPIKHANRRRSTAWLGWGAGAAAAALGFGMVYANTVVGQLDSSYQVEDIGDYLTDRPTPVETDAINILLMGSDSRDGNNGNIGGRVADGMRNDTTILVHISANRERVDLISIPRDAQVPISDCALPDGTVVEGTEQSDFNVAFSHGGSTGSAAAAAACTIATVEDLTGIYIDHYAVVDFTGFIGMVDALGGVPMCIPERIVSTKARLSLEAGPQILDGTQALAFARLRTAEQGSVSGSDLQRISRQQEMLRQVARVALSKNMLTDAGELTQFMKAAATSLTMDPEFGDTKYLIGLAYSLKDVSTANIAFETVPWVLTDDNLNVLLTADAETMWDDIRNDVPLTTVAEDHSGSDWDTGRKDTSATPDADSSAKPEAPSPADLLAECR